VYTVSWLIWLREPLHVVVFVRASKTVACATLLLLLNSIWAAAEDNLQTYVNAQGKVILTNLVERSAASEAVGASTAGTNIPPSLATLVDTISNTHGVDPGLVRAVIKTESNFNRWAVSNKGALGLMQLIPSTGKRYGVRDFFDPQQNVEGGVRYLKFLLQKFKGDLDLSLAAYNAGENLVERWGRIPPIPETRDYVRKVRAIYTKKFAPAMEATAVTSPGGTKDIRRPEASRIFRAVDGRGVAHFSNIEPPN